MMMTYYEYHVQRPNLKIIPYSPAFSRYKILDVFVGTILKCLKLNAAFLNGKGFVYFSLFVCFS